MALKFVRWCWRKFTACCHRQRPRKTRFQLDSESDFHLSENEEEGPPYNHCNPLNVVIPHETQWGRVFRRLYAIDSSFRQSAEVPDEEEEDMPGIHLEVALAEALEVRGAPLKEDELWGVLTQAAEALQDFFLTGRSSLALTIIIIGENNSVLQQWC